MLMLMFRDMTISLYLLLSYSTSSGALGGPGLLLPYSMIELALHIRIKLIITHLSYSNQ